MWTYIKYLLTLLGAVTISEFREQEAILVISKMKVTTYLGSIGSYKLANLLVVQCQNLETISGHPNGFRLSIKLSCWPSCKQLDGQPYG